MKTHRLLPLAALAALASIVALALPSAAAADPPVYCSFKNVPGTRTSAVKARIKARNLQSDTRWTAKCKTARRLVKAAVAKSPTRKRLLASGFNCKPNWLNGGGLDIRWRCKYKGADNPTFSKIAFTLHLHS